MLTGTIKWFNPEKGYGVIRPDNAGGKEVLVQASDLDKCGLSGLVEGQKVQYEMIDDRQRGRESAGNIKPV